MTAEIVVMNGEAVALAADSAVTSQVGGLEKISTSANKLFAMSKYHPVGIMIYGNAEFMDIPWETLIKVYRTKRLPPKGYDRLEEYASDFILFLSNENIEFPEHAEDNYVGAFIIHVLSMILDGIRSRLTEAIQEGRDISATNIAQIVDEVIAGLYDEWRRSDDEYLTLAISRATMRRHSAKISEAISHMLGEYNLQSRQKRRIRELIVHVFSKGFSSSIETGVVVAGFGEKEFRPSVRSFVVEGLVENILKHVIDEQHSLSRDIGGGIVPFAQREMVYRFMEGVDPLYRSHEIGYLSTLCEDLAEKIVNHLSRYSDEEKFRMKQELVDYGSQLVAEFNNEISDFVSEQFSGPIVEAVSRLPKSELASLAEALVHLTSVKRKVSLESETVAEPIDVAVISKGDGFVWVNRKHYFEAELNPQFFLRQYKELLNE
ncbi:MAG TPA: hypothetical protein G4O18_06470 [Dehalococcoidia bacterium]|nr:hypothetical protein [Dehalococcoidia bacterium]